MDNLEQPVAPRPDTEQYHPLPKTKKVYCVALRRDVTAEECRAKTLAPATNLRFCCIGKDTYGCVSEDRACRACVAQGERNPGRAVTQAGYCQFHIDHGLFARRPAGYVEPSKPQAVKKEKVPNKVRPAPKFDRAGQKTAVVLADIKDEWQQVVRRFRAHELDSSYPKPPVFEVAEVVSGLHAENYTMQAISSLFSSRDAAKSWAYGMFSLRNITPEVRQICQKYPQVSFNQLQAVARQAEEDQQKCLEGILKRLRIVCK